MSKKSTIALCCALCFSITGCGSLIGTPYGTIEDYSVSESIIDSIRPEVNHYNEVLESTTGLQGIIELQEQNSIYEDSNSNLVMVTSPNSGSDSGGNNVSEDQQPANGNSNVTFVSPTSFEKIGKETVAASSYSKYLSAEVFTKVKTLLQSCKTESIYFRVFHSGYDSVAGSTTEIKAAPVYDNKLVGKVSSIGGTVLPTFVEQWLGNLNSNDKAIESNRKTVLNKFDSLSATGITSSWIAVKSYSYLPEDILALWGNSRFSSLTAENFVNAVQNTIVGTLPNLRLSVQRSPTASSFVVLNPVASGEIRYADRLSKASTDNLFLYYNQYPKRSCDSPVSFYDYDDNTILWAEINGYSKTIILLGVSESTTLKQELGEQYSTIKNIFDNIYSNTQVKQISSIVNPCNTLNENARGVD